MKGKKKMISWLIMLGMLCPLTFSAMAVQAETFKQTQTNKQTKSVAETVLDNATKAYDYYIADYLENYAEKPGDYGGEWMDATFQMGALNLYDHTKTEAIRQKVQSLWRARGNQLNGGTTTTYLDSVAYSQVVCKLHSYDASVDLTPVKTQLNASLSQGIYDYSWIDEIYMVGYANTYLSQVTGDDAYTDLDFISYQKWRKQLLDFDEGLWYRDTRYVYSLQNPMAVTSDNQKVLWSRGNAWVYVALAEHLSIMDKENPAYKTYLYDFKMMSASLAERQREDGFWNVNLSDSIVGNGKETTGTSGFLYGLSVGIKLGILNKKTYLPIAQKAYEGLTEYALQENGLVGYCQPIGTDPSDYSEALSERSTNSFGVGLYLLGVTAYSDIV